jgi:uncharacterized membrane protein YfcA
MANTRWTWLWEFVFVVILGALVGSISWIASNSPQNAIYVCAVLIALVYMALFRMERRIKRLEGKLDEMNKKLAPKQ